MAFGQSPIEVYDKILKEIKCSEFFQEYITDEESKRQNFKVSSYLFNFCEFFNFHNGDTTIPEKYCKDYVHFYDDDYDKHNNETLRIKGIKKLSDKGKKTEWVYFTKTVNNYIGIVVLYDKWKRRNQDKLLFLFKIKELNNVELIYTDAPNCDDCDFG